MGLTTWVKHITGGNGAAGRWVGHIDSVQRDAIAGWAYDRHNTAAAVTVEAVTASGKSCAKTIADRQRDDLKDAGHGTGRYGFLLDLTHLDLEDETLVVRFAESQVPISKAPVRFDAQRIDAGDTEAVSTTVADQRVVKRGIVGLAHDHHGAAAKSVPAEPLSDYVGYVDNLLAGSVQGWAAYRPDLSQRVSVRVYLDDILVAAGTAKEERADVGAAGFGDGLHGFTLPVPKKALICAQTLVLKAVSEDGREVVCSSRILREPVVRTAPVLYMDASDLIEFLTHHRELSGIQRVQAGYLLGLGNVTIAGTQCRICTRFKYSSFYFDVPYERFAALLKAAGDSTVVSIEAWARYVSSFKKTLTQRANLAEGDTIFTMGAPWALDDHNETIRCAKFFYRAHYLQVFYDLIPISVPEVVAAPLIPHFARAMAAMSIYADHIFSISRYSRDDLTNTLARLERPVPGMSVIPMGGTITDAEGEGVAPAGALDKLGVSGPFVLCVGTLEPRKNHALLFQLWRRLVARHGADRVPRLVLVGRVGWYMEDFMRQLKITGFVEKTVVHLQGVSNAELSVLYDSCLFTIFPSFSEGWGLPITESLARGKVCVCSNVTSMPEAGGSHALYIDPYDTSGAYELVEALIYDADRLAREEAKLASFHAPTWSEASEGLRAQFAEVVPRLAVLPQTPARKPIELGRTYKFYNIEAASPDATSTDVFRNFLDQEDALDLLDGWNWFELDVNCTWGCGPEVALSLVLPEGSEAGFIVYLGLVVPPAYDSMSCEVLLKGLSLGRFKKSGACDISLIIPGSAAREAALTLRFEGNRRPSTDRRLLGIGIAAVAVFAEDDYKGRMKHFEKRAVEALT